MPCCFSTQRLASREARHSKDHYGEVLSCELQPGLSSIKSFPCGHWIHGHHAVTSFILPPGCSRNSKQPSRGRSKPICHVKNNCSSLFHFFRLAIIIWANDCLLKALWWSSHWPPRVNSTAPCHFFDYEQEQNVHNRGLPSSVIKTAPGWRVQSPQFSSYE